MNTFERILAALIVLAIIVLSSFVSWKFGHKNGYSEGYSALHPADTVWKDTTIVKDSIIEVIKWKEKDKLVYVPVRVDSLIHDTTYVALPREFKMYADSTFEAQVSGIDPTLDWIKIHQKTAYITNYVETIRAPKWQVYAFAEASMPFSARAGLGVEENIIGPLNYYINAGYQYNAGAYVTGGLRIILRHE